MKRIMVNLPDDVSAHVMARAEADGRTLSNYFLRLAQKDLAGTLDPNSVAAISPDGRLDANRVISLARQVEAQGLDPIAAMIAPLEAKIIAEQDARRAES